MILTRPERTHPLFGSAAAFLNYLGMLQGFLLRMTNSFNEVIGSLAGLKFKPPLESRRRARPERRIQPSRLQQLYARCGAAVAQDAIAAGRGQI